MKTQVSRYARVVATIIFFISLLGLMFLGTQPTASADTAPVATRTATPTPAPPAVVTLLSPADNAETTASNNPPTGTPTLRWQAQLIATRYHVQISSSSGFGQIIEESDTSATTWTPFKALADGVYYWRVRAGTATTWGAYSNPRRFTKDWGARGTVAVRLSTPPQNAKLSEFAPFFTWETMPGAARYLFQIDNDLNFGSVDYSAISIKAAHTPSLRLADGVYYWRVTPIDYRDHFGAPSELSSFQFEWGLAPTLLSPNADEAQLFTPEFRWTAVNAAREYRLEVSTSPDFNPVTVYTTRNTSFTPDRNLSNDQDYYWHVRAVDAQLNLGPWSQTRRFQLRWNITPRLLTPLNNQIAVPHPEFTWMSVPGAERYQIQVDESPTFAIPIKVDEKVYGTSYAHGNWGTIFLNSTYYWRVRAIDSRNNMTPWSEVRGFDFRSRFAPNPLYPPFFRTSDTNFDIRSSNAVSTPLFVWDTAHDMSTARPFLPATRYVLTVASDPTMSNVVFSISTASNAAAPTQQHPFNGTPDPQKSYYWNIKAYINDSQLGYESTWIARFSGVNCPLQCGSDITLLYPADGRELTVDAPILGWLPVTGANNYRVQIATDSEFNSVVDEAVAQFLNYVPYQGRDQRMPNGVYFWRVKPEPNGAWSQPRRFHINHRTLTGNLHDYPLPVPLSSDLKNRVAQGSDPELNGLFVALDRTRDWTRLNWAINFDTVPSDNLRFVALVDTNHCSENAGSACPGGAGAPNDRLEEFLGFPISVPALNQPEYVLFVRRDGASANTSTSLLTRWNGTDWDPPQSLASIGGRVTDTGADVEVLVPYSALGAGLPTWVGSLALASFTTTGSRLRASAPPATGSTLARFAFTSDLVNPIYPFDMPLGSSQPHYTIPALRWLMPYWDSVDGYQVEVARDPAFTDVFETWESWENDDFNFSPRYMFLPNALTTRLAYANNQSYYWRVRVRHEIYSPSPDKFYDYGPWSQRTRFTLLSYRTSDPPAQGDGMTASPTFMTPTFRWPRIEGAASYQFQLDDNSDFRSPLVSQAVDGVSYTPLDNSTFSALGEGTYYWRVATKRSSVVQGDWSVTQSFTRASLAPTPRKPAAGATISDVPTLEWDPVVAPAGQPRFSSPRYRVKIDDDPNFGSSLTFDTSSTSVTPVYRQAFHDGTWYWKVATLDGNNREGPFSGRQQFYKEYRPPALISPAPGASVEGTPTFRWKPQDSAAYYQLQYDRSPNFPAPVTVKTDNASYTPTGSFPKGAVYWRVQIVDNDNQVGPFALGAVNTRGRQTLPFVAKRRH